MLPFEPVGQLLFGEIFCGSTNKVDKIFCYNARMLLILCHPRNRYVNTMLRLLENLILHQINSSEALPRHFERRYWWRPLYSPCCTEGKWNCRNHRQYWSNNHCKMCVHIDSTFSVLWRDLSKSGIQRAIIKITMVFNRYKRLIKCWSCLPSVLGLACLVP